jgi:tetratricopeptide (TPR) repeat protein
MGGLMVVGLATLFFASGSQNAQTKDAGPRASGIREDMEFIRECFVNYRQMEALEAADRFVREHQVDSDALLQLAGLLAAQSQHARAAELFARVNKLRPHSPNVLYNLGVAYYQLKKLDPAAQALAESADLDGRPAETHYALALIAADRIDHENAVLELQHAIEHAPRRADYYVLLGQEFSTVGYWQGAAKAYRHAVAIEPKEPAHFVHLGDALFRAKDLKGAVDAFQKAARLDPHWPEINYLIAFAYQNDSEFEQAREYYRRQLGMVPEHLKSLLGAGTIDVEQSGFADAEKFLQSALTLDPESIQANYELGLLRFKQQRYDGAIEVFKRVLALRPDHTQAEYYLYLTLSRIHQDAAAASALATWKKLEALDRKVRSQEVAYDMARAERWQKAAASAN